MYRWICNIEFKIGYLDTGQFGPGPIGIPDLGRGTEGPESGPGDLDQGNRAPGPRPRDPDPPHPPDPPRIRNAWNVKIWTFEDFNMLNTVLFIIMSFAFRDTSCDV